MKIKIDENGLLYIERAGKLKKQYCPYADSLELGRWYCGDWCPLFGETDTDALEISGHIALSICLKTFIVAEEGFIDERRDDGTNNSF